MHAATPSSLSPKRTVLKPNPSSNRAGLIVMEKATARSAPTSEPKPGAITNEKRKVNEAMTHDPSNLESDSTSAPTPRKPWAILEAALADVPEPQHHELTRVEHAALASRVSTLALQPNPDHPQRFAYPTDIRDTLQRAALVHATLAAASTHCFPGDPNYGRSDGPTGRD